MAKEITTQDEMEQVEALEKEAQESPDASVFTRKLNKPFTYENTTVEAAQSARSWCSSRAGNRWSTPPRQPPCSGSRR